MTYHIRVRKALVGWFSRVYADLDDRVMVLVWDDGWGWSKAGAVKQAQTVIDHWLNGPSPKWTDPEATP